jgi:alcohol dehydrogenase (cytochrome c)
MGTIDAHLLAIDAFTGKLIWNITVADATDPACKGQLCYVITHAPLVVRDKVIVGVGGGEGPIRGFIAAYDVTTGKEVWRFYTVPAAGEPGSETWSGDSWKTGGGGVWKTGAYDPDLNLTYWGTGNPYPWSLGNEAGGGNTRLGNNLLPIPWSRSTRTRAS